MKSKSRSYRAIPYYYDAEYETSPVLDNDVPFMLQHLPDRPQRVLELCCGTGRACIRLAEAGHRVVGVDYDKQLLAIADRKRTTSGLDDSRLKLVHADVLRLKLNQKFDFACLIFNTFLNFTTLADQDRLLSRTASHLKRGGQFWIDIFYPDLRILAEANHAHYDSATFYVHELDRSVHRTTEITRSSKHSQVQELTFHYTWADANGTLHEEKSEFDLTWMFPRELVILLERHGFVVEELYGDYDGTPVTPESPRIIALAKKR